MASPISDSATRSPPQSVISKSSCRRTRCFIRSPTCRRHLRQQQPLPVPALHCPPLAFRCNPILRNSQLRIRSPCSLLLPLLPPQSHRRCSARHCLHLCKASLLQFLHRCQPLIPPSLALLQDRLPFLLPPNLHRRPPWQHSHSQQHSRLLHLNRNLCSHSPERFNLSAPHSRFLKFNRPLLRVHLSLELLNRLILLPPPPQDPWRPEHLRNQDSTAPNCSGRFPHRSSQPLLSLLRPRPNQPRACLPPRCLLPSSPHLPLLQPWKKFHLSPHLRPPHHSLPHVDCSAPRR